jgi:hypothetical protein
LVVVATSALLPAVLAGCGDDWRSHPIWSYDLETESRLTVEGHCNDDGRVVVVDQDGERVELRLEVQGERRGDCLSCPEVTLDEPLGDRTVVDASRDEAVPRDPDMC